MEPIEAVNQEAFAAFISEHGYASPTNIPYILRFWNDAKTDWFHSFGDKLVLEKRISYTENKETTIERMRELTLSSPDYHDIYDTLLLAMAKLKGVYSCEVLVLLSPAVLANNCYNDVTITIPLGKGIKIQKGCKPLPTIHKLLRAIDFSEEVYERFRIAHSQILNSTKVHGTLCLSIDPLDYITMSDNDSNWSSCMSWADHNGEYHGGTIEMMNSPDVLIAYIKSDEPYYPCGNSYPFSNKKWRQLIIAHKDILLGNRHYPFHCEEAEQEALYWVKEIMETTMSCSFSNELIPLRNNSNRNPKDVYLNISTDVMYNDVYDTRNGFLTTVPVDHNIELDISGPRNCMSCGELIDLEAPPEWVTCIHCNDAVICENCGAYVVNDDSYFSNSLGQCFCRDCVDNAEVTFCSCCDEPYMDCDITPLDIDFDDDPDYSNIRTAYLCPDCYRSIPFGDFGEKDKYGYYHYGRTTSVGTDFIDGLEI